MARSDDLKRERDEYSSALSSVYSASSSLSAAIGGMNGVIQQCVHYKIDGVAMGKTFLEDLLDDEKSASFTISDTVIPGIEAHIEYLDEAIQEALRQEEEERRRQEEEERRRREEEEKKRKEEEERKRKEEEERKNSSSSSSSSSSDSSSSSSSSSSSGSSVTTYKPGRAAGAVKHDTDSSSSSSSPGSRTISLR